MFKCEHPPGTPNRGVEPLCAIMSFDPDGLGW